MVSIFSENLEKFSRLRVGLKSKRFLRVYVKNRVDFLFITYYYISAAKYIKAGIFFDCSITKNYLIGFNIHYCCYDSLILRLTSKENRTCIVALDSNFLRVSYSKNLCT